MIRPKTYFLGRSQPAHKRKSNNPPPKSIMILEAVPLLPLILKEPSYERSLFGSLNCGNNNTNKLLFEPWSIFILQQMLSRLPTSFVRLCVIFQEQSAVGLLWFWSRFCKQAADTVRSGCVVRNVLDTPALGVSDVWEFVNCYDLAHSLS